MKTGVETSKGKGRELSWFPPGSLAACEERATGTRVEAGSSADGKGCQVRELGLVLMPLSTLWGFSSSSALSVRIVWAS